MIENTNFQTRVFFLDFVLNVILPFTIVEYNSIDYNNTIKDL
jgi:hypothetical protein